MDRRFIEELENCDFFICPNLNQPQKKFITIIVLSFLLGAGFIVVLLGCSLWPNGWWSLFVLIALFAAAVPDFIFNRISRKKSNSDFDSDSLSDSAASRRRRCVIAFYDGWFVIAGFFGGTALFWLPLTLYHNHVIHKNTLALNISGVFLIAISGFLFMKLVYNRFQIQLFNKQYLGQLVLPWTILMIF